MITPLLPQLPPRAAKALASTCGVPPEIAIVGSLPLAKNATKAPSGDQKGKLAPCVPGSGVTLGEPTRCTKSIGNAELSSGDTNTNIAPSRETATWLMLISSGTANANCMRVVG